MAATANTVMEEATYGSVQKVETLLGGSRTLARRLTSALDVHELTACMDRGRFQETVFGDGLLPPVKDNTYAVKA